MNQFRTPASLLIVVAGLSFFSADSLLANNGTEIPLIGTISLKGAEISDFSKLAKVSLSDAIKAANGRVSGKVFSASLENEGGFLVYAVEIVTRNKKSREVIVDAGTGKVISSQMIEEKVEVEDKD